ncbi:hydroxysqualene dehydroxylase HpnE [Sphingomonas bacterium]|uniref:hydroxysqualene dehydroxylase HpnE n=1 Tax=Sphingomonas bacterium TaxID=1895847 RepID=UPI00157732E7|nr:hydroxysqualene dehydroxylase HpnE [Sphingomonas bacterium]
MSFGHVTIAGAGMAGLSAAVALAKAGVAVSLGDSAAQAGGRCRSYHDPQLGLTIDNGNHLVLSGNAAVERFRATVGAPAMTGPDHADFAFADLASGERWTVAINDGRLPWWTASAKRRVPGTRLTDYLGLARLITGGPDRTVADRIDARGPLWERFLDPILLAVLNTPSATGSARLTGNVLRETVARGGTAMRPRIAHPSLAAAFVEPALGWLIERGTRVATGRRLRALAFDGDRIAGLDWGNGVEPVAADEAVMLALPAWAATSLVPGLTAPTEHRAIVNGHFAFTPPPGTPAMIGLLGGTAEWVFAFPDRLSVTVSAADHLVDRDRKDLARAFWTDIAAVHGIDAPMPRWQIVKEKRATFAATPAQDALRPPAHTRWRNLFLAGDWTQTGLPATIEGAIRSGETAAGLALAADTR